MLLSVFVAARQTVCGSRRRKLREAPESGFHRPQRHLPDIRLFPSTRTSVCLAALHVKAHTVNCGAVCHCVEAARVPRRLELARRSLKEIYDG
jgi:hypothetical protein